MAEFPALPLWTDAYLGDTTHLTTIEHGAYLLLLISMWRAGGSLPDDDKLLARYVRMTPAQWARIKATVRAFFRVDAGAIFSEEMSDWTRRYMQESSRPAIPMDVRRRVWERDDGRCSYCGTGDVAMHLDHVFPWSRGGRHTVENLVVSCMACNLSKGSMTPQEWRGQA